jgi:hypothetical protein
VLTKILALYTLLFAIIGTRGFIKNNANTRAEKIAAVALMAPVFILTIKQLLN